MGLKYETPVAEGVITGVIKSANLMVRQEEGKLYVNVNVWGTFGTGGQTYADRMANEFKEKLQEKLKT